MLEPRVIHINDNCTRGVVVDNHTDVENLSFFLNKSIQQLTIEDNLLIFPYSLSEYGDELGKQTIGSLQIIDKRAHLHTGNIIGFVGKGDTQLHIYSRFGTEKEDYFLYYMLCRVYNINVFNLPYSQGNEAALDLLILLFPYYLSKALQQGIYSEYRTYHHNDANVRGVININRHIQRNIPFQGNIAYHERVKSIDNSLTQLIRHTIEYISVHPIGSAILTRNADTRHYVEQIMDATPSYNHRNRFRVINDNLRPKVHPYYSEYRPLQQLCMQILQYEQVSYGNSCEQVYGILFDAAWLWEEYLATILRKQGFKHPRNKTGEGGICLFTNGTGIRYPDFYHPLHKTVFDAKYKILENASRVSDIDRNDIHQIITYMHVLSSPIGGIIYPSMSELTDSPHAILKGQGGEIYLYPFHIPQTDTWDKFVKQIENSEIHFVQSLKH